MGAAHVVRQDLQARDRVGMGFLAQHQVAVLLVRVRLLGFLLDADHPAPDRPGLVAQGALEREVARRVRRHVLLERVVVEVLVAVGEVRARDARRRPLAGQVVLDSDLSLLRTEAACHPVELGISRDPRVVGREVPRVLRQILD